MRSLFFKIFLWFWLAMALMGAALWVSVPPRPQPAATRWREIAPAVLRLYAQTAVQTYEEQGAEALHRNLDQLESATHLHAFLFDMAGQELSGGPQPPGVDMLASRAASSGQEEFDATGRGLRAAQRIQSSRGRQYVIVGEIPTAQLGPPPAPSRFPALRLLAVLLTASLVCYALARYLTAPIVELRAATHRFADGDFAARAGQTVEGRHDELGDLGRDFNSMAGRIESLMAAQRRLIGDVSHELRSPLARLGVALELARGQEVMENSRTELTKALDRSEREVARLNTLIGQLLTLSRLESGVPLAERMPVDLARLVSEVAVDADFEARSRARSVRLVETCACQVYGAEELLRSAIENVVRNAVRYTAEGTEVQIALRHEVATVSQSACCLLTIRDQGTGVPEAELGDLFRPFYRVASARERSTGGVGLGLAITERAALLHGGTVTASNAPAGGLCVELRLPALPHHSETATRWTAVDEFSEGRA